MTLEEFEKASNFQLRGEANRCFDLADKSGGLDKPHLYQQASFYIAEIERRDREHAERRSYWLELVVILLIVFEILVTFYEGHEQDKVLSQVERNFNSTTATLTSLQGTMEAMNVAIQAERGGMAGIAVSVTYSAIDRQLVITNTGRADLKIVMYQYDGRRGRHFNPPELLRKGQAFSDIETDSVKRFLPASEESAYLLFRVVLRKPDGSDVFAETTLTVTRVNGDIRISAGPTIMR